MIDIIEKELSMKNLFVDAITGIFGISIVFGAGEILCRVIIALTGIPEPIVYVTMALVILAFTVPMVVPLLSTDPSSDTLLRILVLAPSLAVAVTPLLIERAHHVAGFDFWEKQLPFETRPFYGEPLAILGFVALLATLPVWRAKHLNR
ncbi:hypothetical protein F1643_18135 [Azospirillum sp. INR13]|uniref:hypothetical protein n=1 Tax=Azospirillum sp. INR13 TaxID=2596919 RepID=UPI0018926555|nr:hypothetical protein [Azospirillum sp. INR13]MBF5096011.1 hypothetical protein [Azospirillum sp. INR13]